MRPDNNRSTMCVLSENEDGVAFISEQSAYTFALEMAEAKVELLCLASASSFVETVAKAMKRKGGCVRCVDVCGRHRNSELCRIADEISFFSDLHTFKMHLFHHATSLLVFPDCIFTLDILMEYLTWMQRVYRRKPVYVIKHGSYGEHLLKIFERMERCRFLPEAFKERFTAVDGIAGVVPNLLTRVSE